MNGVNTLKETELAVAKLSQADKAQLLKWLARDVENVFPGIEKNPKIMGGAACIRQTRIPVWLLEQARRQNVGEVDLLRSYPHLTAQDLVNAWDYVSSHKQEIEQQIAETESLSEKKEMRNNKKVLAELKKIIDEQGENPDFDLSRSAKIAENIRQENDRGFAL